MNVIHREESRRKDKEELKYDTRFLFWLESQKSLNKSRACAYMLDANRH